MKLSIAELAHFLATDPRFVAETAGMPSMGLIEGSELDAALRSLKAAHGASTRAWDVGRMANNSEPWADVLRELYAIPVSFPASLPPSQGQQLREIALAAKARNCAEIGCFIGVSSIWLASAISDNGGGNLVSIDLFEPKYPNRFHYSYLDDPLAVAEAAAKKAGLSDIIKFAKSESGSYAKELTGSMKLDLVFIDGDHSFVGIARDFLAYFPLLRSGGIAILHDTNPEHCGWFGPRRFIDKYLAKSDQIAVREIETEPNFGIAVITKLGNGSPFPPLIQMELLLELLFKSILRSLFGSQLARVLKRNVLWRFCSLRRDKERG